MAIAAAAATLIDRVDPYWLIETTQRAAASASGERPGPSCPNTRTHRGGRSTASSGIDPGTTSTATMGTSAAAAQLAKVATSG